jgi:GNAT superfamily N-acetyltransferase
MSKPDKLTALAYQSLANRLACGHETVAGAGARFVRDPRVPVIYDANFAHSVRASSPAECDALFAEADRVYAGLGHRQFFWDPETPESFEARLQLDGYTPTHEIILALEGELRQRGPRVELRPAESDRDWQILEDLCWLDHCEEAEKGFHAPWDREVTRQIVLAKRVKGPAVRYFLATVDGADCAFFSGWPGENGVGQVEDLFTLAAFRGRGIGTALIAACVDDSRARGAGPVLIGARMNDTPKHLYAALGFRPLCVQRMYLKTEPE